jgi:DNA-binding response OmpR family regulator
MTTILLVEDAYELAQMIIRELEVQGYQVLHTRDGVSALQVHAAQHPSLVILDWMLPELDGLEVRALLRRAEFVQQLLQTDLDRTGELLTYRELYMNPQSHMVTLDSIPLDLSPIEFALLHLMLRSPGRAFSRSYLLDTVWGETYVGGDRSVDNTILRLRKKLGSLGEAIETVWGIGYRLRPTRQR